MPADSPARYLLSLIRELEGLYTEYATLINNMTAKKSSWKTQGLQNFLILEGTLSRKAVAREKILHRFLQEKTVPPGSVSPALEKLDEFRQVALRDSLHLMKEIRFAMNKLEQEQKSLRIPRSKPMKKESAPALIDIRL